jgi:hypothetical protein
VRLPTNCRYIRASRISLDFIPVLYRISYDYIPVLYGLCLLNVHGGITVLCPWAFLWPAIVSITMGLLLARGPSPSPFFDRRSCYTMSADHCVATGLSTGRESFYTIRGSWKPFYGVIAVLSLSMNAGHSVAAGIS